MLGEHHSLNPYPQRLCKSWLLGCVSASPSRIEGLGQEQLHPGMHWPAGPVNQQDPASGGCLKGKIKLLRKTPDPNLCSPHVYTQTHTCMHHTHTTCL